MRKKQFKAESQKLLDMMINSIYTHKEIFLREIISNSSDAIDKLCYTAMNAGDASVSRTDCRIRVLPDKENRTLTISDNGIGMDDADLESNLGVIARSGSLSFKKDAAEAEDMDIIGQFGVGFYSAFMVADEVTVVTRKYGSEQAWMWKSSGADGYTIEPTAKESVGTDIIIHLKADGEEETYSEYLETYTLRNLIKKYSDYIRYPILLNVEKSRKVDVPDSDEPKYET